MIQMLNRIKVCTCILTVHEFASGQWLFICNNCNGVTNKVQEVRPVKSLAEQLHNEGFVKVADDGEEATYVKPPPQQDKPFDGTYPLRTTIAGKHEKGSGV